MKYRIVQKGDLFSAQSKFDFLAPWHIGAWTTKEKACYVVKFWERVDEDLIDRKSKSMKGTIIHKPEDLCGGRQPKKRPPKKKVRLDGTPVTSLGGVKSPPTAPRPSEQPQGQQPK